MIREYIDEAMRHARYEIIKDEEPYYGEIAGLQGVWATGKTLEECRQQLADALDGWILIRIARNLPVPPIGGVELAQPREFKVA